MLDLETVGQEGIAAGGVNDKTRFPGLLAAIVVLSANHRATVIRQKINCPRLAALMHLNAFFRGIADQHVIKLGPLDLIGIRLGFVPGIGKMKGLRHAMLRRDELSAPLFHADGFYFFSNAHAFEKRHIGR